jgi:hypothetical protein
MIDFIRRTRQFCGPVEQRHCLYGADADLVLLAMATRERNIVILREVGHWLCHAVVLLLWQRLVCVCACVCCIDSNVCPAHA